MSASPHEVFADPRRLLSHLLAEVVAARAREEAQRRQRGGHAEALYAARLNTLGALVDYAGAIESLSWPVPRGIQQEIRLHQALVRRP